MAGSIPQVFLQRVPCWPMDSTGIEPVKASPAPLEHCPYNKPPARFERAPAVAGQIPIRGGCRLRGGLVIHNGIVNYVKPRQQTVANCPENRVPFEIAQHYTQ